ncbi:MAG: HD-GYP domain-containing protein [Dethiobacteria bacterium]|jgi:HD-GYP domain-containing protein (c-di-GMP phosphodiesterase class II)
MYNNKINACSKSAVVYSCSTMSMRNYPYLPGIENNMQSMAVTLAKEAGLSREDIAAVAVLSLVHDIGKVAIPDNIIYKKGALLPQERKVMEKHPLIGQHIALSSSEIEVVANYILSHHEWWNGGGYPNGLKAHEIPYPVALSP